MSDYDLDESVADWVIDHPHAASVFQRLGIDYCCGGKSLRYACHQAGLDPENVVLEIRQSASDEDKRDSPVLLSIQVGLPQQLGHADAADPLDRLWTTGFFKQPVAGPVGLTATNLEGDGQADSVHHGGRDKAILGYSANHYPQWRRILGKPEIPFGGFGENLTILDLTEADVCIGDIWQIGDAVRVQVSQPRQPCWKLARWWKIKTLALQVQRTGRTGWYYRVLNTGTVESGMPLTLQERPHPNWPVQRANHVMHEAKDDTRLAAELAAIPQLSSSWKETLTRRAEEGVHPDPATRLEGESQR